MLRIQIFGESYPRLSRTYPWLRTGMRSGCSCHPECGQSSSASLPPSPLQALSCPLRPGSGVRAGRPARCRPARLTAFRQPTYDRSVLPVGVAVGTQASHEQPQRTFRDAWHARSAPSPGPSTPDRGPQRGALARLRVLAGSPADLHPPRHDVSLDGPGLRQRAGFTGWQAPGARACPITPGTHLDAPFHFNPAGVTVESVDLRRTVGPALLLDVTTVKTPVEPVRRVHLERARWRRPTTG